VLCWCPKADTVCLNTLQPFHRTSETTIPYPSKKPQRKEVKALPGVLPEQLVFQRFGRAHTARYKVENASMCDNPNCVMLARNANR